MPAPNMDCQPPSEIDGSNSLLASTVGDTVEEIIRKDYCASKGGCAEFPLLGTQEFFDRRVAFGGTITTFIAFLKANNPSVDEVALSIQFTMPDADMKIPDIMTHQPLVERFEYYEIKPNSARGRADGIAKVLALTALCGLNKLPYVPGVIYRPDEMITLLIERTGYIEVEVFLHFFWLSPGLIVYEICSRTKVRVPVPFPQLEKALQKAAHLLVLLALVLLAAGIVIFAEA